MPYKIWKYGLRKAGGCCGLQYWLPLGILTLSGCQPVAHGPLPTSELASTSSSSSVIVDPNLTLASAEEPPKSGLQPPSPSGSAERVKIRFAPKEEVKSTASDNAGNDNSGNGNASNDKAGEFILASSGETIPDTTEQPPTNSVADVRAQQKPSEVLASSAIQQKGANSIEVASEAERNQVIAPNWPKPWAAFFVTGQQHGYLEPCGCTGLENQKGGLNRRDTLLQEIQQRGWELIPIDAGSQIQRIGHQSTIKFWKSAEALTTMKYKAVSFGYEDLNLSATNVYYTLIKDGDKTATPFISANVEILDPTAMETARIITVGQKKIGIIAVLGDEWAKKVQNADVKVSPMVEATKAAFKKIAQCNYKVLIAHATIEESEQIARAVKDFDLVVTAGGYGEPTNKPELITGTTKSQMIQVGVKGMHAGLVGLYDDPKNPVRYQRIALSSQFADSKRMMEIFKKYQNELKESGLEGLGVRPITHSSGREFVGTEKCGECHTTAFDIWKKTGHALATDHLINPPERGDIPRHFDPECLSCHTTGWNPQEYFPYRTGYLSVEETPHMMQNGCENCHGPGAAHVAAQEDTASTQELLKKLQEEMRLPLDRARDKCMECHDLDNSPEFHHGDHAFEEYWEKVKHYGKD